MSLLRDLQLCYIIQVDHLRGGGGGGCVLINDPVLEPQQFAIKAQHFFHHSLMGAKNLKGPKTWRVLKTIKQGTVEAKKER